MHIYYIDTIQLLPLAAIVALMLACRGNSNFQYGWGKLKTVPVVQST